MPLAKGRHPAKTPTRRTVYVRADDAEVWRRAEEFAGDSLSQLVADLLRQYVARRDGQAGGLERIVLEAVVKGDAPPGPWEKGDIRKVAFYGRALTKGGKIAVLELDTAEGTEHGDPPYLKLYDSLEAADKDGIPHFVLD